MHIDPFDLGCLSPEDIKNTFGQMVNDIQFLPAARLDLIIERIEDAKHQLIDLAARNTELFEVKRRK